MKIMLPSSSEIKFILVTFSLLVAFSGKVLAAEKRALSKTGANNNGENGKNKWYDKWYTSDTVYIDGDGNAKEGSGVGPFHPDTDTENEGSGASADDEDSMQGSGDDQKIDDFVEESSGDGAIWIDRHQSKKVTTKRPTVTSKSPPTERTWWPQLQRTTTSRIRGVTDFSEEDANVIAEEPPRRTEAPGATAAPPYNVVPTEAVDSTIYDTRKGRRSPFDPFLRPGVLAAVIGGAVVGLLAAILLVMFIVYRMRKKDEGSYALEEPKQPPSYPYAYHKAPTKEFYA